MKKKIIASALVVSMVATSVGLVNCSAFENVLGGDAILDSNFGQNFTDKMYSCVNGVFNFYGCEEFIAGRFCPAVDENSSFSGKSESSKPTLKEQLAGVCGENTNKALCAGQKTFFLGKKGLEGLKAAYGKLSRFTSAQKDVIIVLSSLPWIARSAVTYAGTLKNKILPRKQLKPDQIVANLDEGFKKIKGQAEPKRKIRKAIDGIIGKKQMAKASNAKYKRGDVIYLVGPSGVGKTFSAEILAKALMGKYKPLVLSPANVDLVSKTSVVSQLFGLQSGFSYYGGSDMKEQASLVQYIKLNPGGVVIINEYDKMHTPGLDEIFRTIMDDGEVNIQGQKIDCSGVTFIITSNESTASASGANLDETKDDDGTGSRTHIKHDKAFMNRVNLVEFENLRYEDYKEIAKDTFEGIAKNFEKQYGIQVNVDGIIDGAAKRAEKINQGSRPIVDDMINGFIQILMAKRREDETGENGKGKTFSAFYDQDKDEFQISEINKAGEVVNTTTSGIVFQDELDEQIRKEKALEDANKPKEEKTPEQIELEKVLANLNIAEVAVG